MPRRGMEILQPGEGFLQFAGGSLHQVIMHVPALCKTGASLLSQGRTRIDLKNKHSHCSEDQRALCSHHTPYQTPLYHIVSNGPHAVLSATISTACTLGPDLCSRPDSLHEGGSRRGHDRLSCSLFLVHGSCRGHSCAWGPPGLRAVSVRCGGRPRKDQPSSCGHGRRSHSEQELARPG